MVEVQNGGVMAFIDRVWWAFSRSVSQDPAAMSGRYYTTCAHMATNSASLSTHVVKEDTLRYTTTD